jgi:hypothetical protein
MKPDVLVQGPPRRRRGLLTAGSVLVVVTLLVSGITVAARELGGGGAQPERFVPAAAVAFAKLDYDPPAGQKLAAWRFGDGPAAASLAGFAGQVLGGVDELAKVDFARDVQPWLGDRAGVAVLPPAKRGGEPQVEVVLQVGDAERAASGLRALSDRLGGKVGYVLRDGYAILARDQATDGSVDGSLDGSVDESGPRGGVVGPEGPDSNFVRGDFYAKESTELPAEIRENPSPEEIREYETEMRAGSDTRAAPTPTERKVQDKAMREWAARSAGKLTAEQKKGLTPAEIRETERLLRAENGVTRSDEDRAYEEDGFTPGARLVVGARFEGGRLSVRGRVTGSRQALVTGGGGLGPALERLPAGTDVALGLDRPADALELAWDPKEQRVPSTWRRRCSPSASRCRPRKWRPGWP